MMMWTVPVARKRERMGSSLHTTTYFFVSASRLFIPTNGNIQEASRIRRRPLNSEKHPIQELLRLLSRLTTESTKTLRCIKKKSRIAIEEKCVERIVNCMTLAQVSSIELLQMMSRPEHFLRNPANPSFFITFYLKGQVILDPIDASSTVLILDNGGTSFIREHEMKPAW